MFPLNVFPRVLLVIISFAPAANVALAAVEPLDKKYADAPAALHRAYFLEHHAKDYDAAKRLYDELVEDESSAFQPVAVAGSQRCRDHLVARNFARVMPAETIAYVEFHRPGEIVRELAGMLGLTDKSVLAALASRPNAQSPVPYYVPNEIVISPAIFDALETFGGMAVAVTEFDVEGDRPPAGVLVLHHGDFSLLKGVLETALQFAPTAEKIRNMPTFGTNIPDVGEITGVLTESLLIVGTGRNLVEEVVGRIDGGGGGSLASSEQLAEAIPADGRGMFFAYVDIKRVLGIVEKTLDGRDREEFERVNAIADFKSLRWATFSMGVDDGILGARAVVRLDDEHQSLVYNLLRLSPMSGKCLSLVPPDAAAVIGVGLNPPMATRTDDGKSDTDSAASARPPISAFDIGREFFGNTQEFCAYVVPGTMGTAGSGHDRFPVPNVGLLFAVNDSKKSMALWNEILRLPGLIAEKEPVSPKPTKIGGVEATAYTIPEFGNVYLAEIDGCISLGVTRQALKSAARAQASNKSILDDDALGPVLSKLGGATSVVFAGHLGRLAQVGAGTGDVEVCMVANPMSQLCRDTVTWVTISQSPNQFTASFAMTGLPKINDALRQFGPFINAATGTFVDEDEEVERAARESDNDEDAIDARPPARNRKNKL